MSIKKLTNDSGKTAVAVYFPEGQEFSLSPNNWVDMTESDFEAWGVNKCILQGDFRGMSNFLTYVTKRNRKWVALRLEPFLYQVPQKFLGEIEILIELAKESV